MRWRSVEQVTRLRRADSAESYARELGTPPLSLSLLTDAILLASYASSPVIILLSYGYRVVHQQVRPCCSS